MIFNKLDQEIEKIKLLHFNNKPIDFRFLDLIIQDLKSNNDEIISYQQELQKLNDEIISHQQELQKLNDEMNDKLNSILNNQHALNYFR